MWRVQKRGVILVPSGWVTDGKGFARISTARASAFACLGRRNRADDPEEGLLASSRLVDLERAVQPCAYIG